MLLIIFLTIAHSSENNFVVTMMEGEIEDDPVRYAEWCNEPEVVVCKNSGLDKSTVEGAYYFLGQSIDKIKMGECECKVKPGTIQFGVECFERGSRLGITFMGFDTTTECMIGSVVQIYEDKPIVITHEAGHSIGWMHSSLTNHIMFPFYRHAGWDTEGMK